MPISISVSDVTHVDFDLHTIMSDLLLPIPFQPLLLREYADILQQQFHKRFSLTPCDPPRAENGKNVFKSDYWSDYKLQSMKQRLNETKSQLNNLPLDKWHKHTRYVSFFNEKKTIRIGSLTEISVDRKLNPAATVSQMVKKSSNPELLTQAWLKFHECYHVFDLGPKPEQKEFNSVHLCEAPGAFTTSLNHALVLHHNEV